MKHPILNLQIMNHNLWFFFPHFFIYSRRIFLANVSLFILTKRGGGSLKKQQLIFKKKIARIEVVICFLNMSCCFFKEPPPLLVKINNDIGKEYYPFLDKKCGKKGFKSKLCIYFNTTIFPMTSSFFCIFHLLNLDHVYKIPTWLSNAWYVYLTALFSALIFFWIWVVVFSNSLFWSKVNNSMATNIRFE